jgi:hypothetical protein
MIAALLAWRGLPRQRRPAAGVVTGWDACSQPSWSSFIVMRRLAMAKLDTRPCMERTK